jgi:hypothetical protein
MTLLGMRQENTHDYVRNMYIKDYKIVVVLFHPGQGGNHLANVISTSDQLADRFVTENYKQALITYYDSPEKNAHVEGISNEGVHDIDALKKYINDNSKPVVICGHIPEFYHCQEFIKSLVPIGIINFENYNLNNLVRERTKMHSDLIEWAYRTDVVSKTFEIDHTHIYTTSANNLFCTDPSEFFSSISHDLGLNLDMDYCLKLHEKWIKKIF